MPASVLLDHTRFVGSDTWPEEEHSVGQVHGLGGEVPPVQKKFGRHKTPVLLVE